MTTATLAKPYPLRKKCSSCGKRRATGPLVETLRGGLRAGKFRVLKSGYLQGMCVDCERGYEHDRWSTRPNYRRAAAA